MRSFRDALSAPLRHQCVEQLPCLIEYLVHMPDRCRHFMHERITAEARAALEPAAFERAWEAGRLLPLEEAVAEALVIAEDVLTEAKR
jgi:hypothetical protein